jgi:hypothetical protein
MFKKIDTLVLLLCVIPSVASATSNLPGTGQTRCYQASPPYEEIPCAGLERDGAYSINSLSFSDNRNGMVTDRNTGLTWQKEDDHRKYNWYQASGSYDPAHNQSVQDVCGMLNLGGLTDWRLPTKKELMSIVDYSVPYPGPAISSAYFPNTVAFHYWTSSTFAGDPDLAWHVSFVDGHVSYNNKNDPLHVRCVRGRQQAIATIGKGN